MVTGATSFRTVGCRPLGPAALDGFRAASNFRTPLSVTWMLGILANLRFKNVPGFGVLEGKVLTELLVQNSCHIKV